MSIPEEERDEFGRLLPASILFVFFPILLIVPGLLVLTELPGLLGQYNYLRGAPSLIDQIAQASLGSDVTRAIVLVSGVFGMAIGLYLSHFVSRKLKTVREEGRVEISQPVYLCLFMWWILLTTPNTTIQLWQLIAFESSSHFLADIGSFLMAGSFLSYSLPVLVAYAITLWHADLNNSKIEFRIIQDERGLELTQQIEIRIAYSGSEL